MRINVLICAALLSVLVTVVRGERELLIDRPPPMMEMTVEVRPNTALLGDTVSIVISATNREKETIRLPFRAMGCAFSFRITGPHGESVKVRKGCPREADSLTLVPGETVRDTFEVTLVVPDQAPAEPDSELRGRAVFILPEGTIYDLSYVPPTIVAWPIEQDRIAPGVYRIEGGIRGQDFRWAADDLLVQ